MADGGADNQSPQRGLWSSLCQPLFGSSPETNQALPPVPRRHPARSANSTSPAPASPNPLPTAPCIVCGRQTFRLCLDCGRAFTCSRACSWRSTRRHKLLECTPYAAAEATTASTLLLAATLTMEMPDDESHAQVRREYGFFAAGEPHSWVDDFHLLAVYRAVNQWYVIGGPQLDMWRAEGRLGERIAELLDWRPDDCKYEVHLVFEDLRRRGVFDGI